MIHTRITGVGNLHAPAATPVGAIRSKLNPDAVYDSLQIRHGVGKLDVSAVQDDNPPSDLKSILSQRPPANGHRHAYISGGFFVHMRNLLDDNRVEIPVGYAVGETKGKNNWTPVPKAWREDYAAICDANGTALIHSGPKLEKEQRFDDKRFQYRLAGSGGRRIKSNPANRYAGALSHASENNQRGAISVGREDVRLHTLTTRDGKRLPGVTMRDWSEIVTARHEDMEHTNLDGGGSVNMGIHENGRIRPIATGKPMRRKPRRLLTVLTTESDPQASSRQPSVAQTTSVPREPVIDEAISSQPSDPLVQPPADGDAPVTRSRLCCFPNPWRSGRA